MRIYTILFAITFLFTGCYSQVPKPATYPMTSQQKMQAAAHWNVLADDVAAQIAGFLKNRDESLADRFGIYIEPLPGTFGRAFTNMLTARLVQSNIRVLHKSENCPVIQFETQVIRHKTDRFDRPVPGTMTALAAGIYVLREITWDTLAVLGIPAAAVADFMIGKKAVLPHSEVLITTSVIGTNNRYLLYRTDLYYINDKDWRLYPPEDRPLTDEDYNENKTKTFKVTSG